MLTVCGRSLRCGPYELDLAFGDEERNFEIQCPERRLRLEAPEVYVRVAD